MRALLLLPFFLVGCFDAACWDHGGVEVRSASWTDAELAEVAVQTGSSRGDPDFPKPGSPGTSLTEITWYGDVTTSAWVGPRDTFFVVEMDPAEGADAARERLAAFLARVTTMNDTQISAFLSNETSHFEDSVDQGAAASPTYFHEAVGPSSVPLRAQALWMEVQDDSEWLFEWEFHRIAWTIPGDYLVQVHAVADGNASYQATSTEGVPGHAEIESTVSEFLVGEGLRAPSYSDVQRTHHDCR